MNFLFGGIGIVLIPSVWGAASRSHAGWSWGFLGAAAGILVAYVLLRGWGVALPRERAAVSLGIACVAIGGFVGFAQLSDREETSATPVQSLPPDTPASNAPPSVPPATSSPLTSTPPTSEEWTALDPSNIVFTADGDCGAFYGWDGPKELVVDRIEIEEGYDVAGSCDEGMEVRAAFAFEGDAAGFRVTVGILKDSGDPGPIPVRVLPNEDDSQEICEGNVSVGHPLELTMSVTGLSRVTIVAFLPEYLTQVDEVVGLGNAEISYQPSVQGAPSCGSAFEPES